MFFNILSIHVYACTHYVLIIPVASFPYTHHMILYDCTGHNFSTLTDEQLKGAPCDDTPLEACENGPIIAVWGVGGQGFQFPDDVSLSFGGPGGAQYFILQTHYSNPSMLSKT
jgi:hypothetical protein